MPKIDVKFSFLAVNSLIFLFRDNRMILAFYAACLLHELGHAAAVYLLGGSISGIELGGFGLKMTATRTASVGGGVFVLLSGPAVNLLMYAVLRATGNCGYFALYNAAEGLLNLLPYSFLDGGAVLGLLAEGSPHEALILRIYTILKIAITVIIAIITILLIC